MPHEVIMLLVSIHHQLVTDADLQMIVGAPKYFSLMQRIERVLLKTEYAYLCTHLEEEHEPVG